jgi:hypothetical protein
MAANITSIGVPSMLAPVVSAFGNPIIFVLAVFITFAIVLSLYKVHWAVSIEIFIVVFAAMSSFGFFGYAIVQLLVIFMFAIMGFGFTKIFADLIFG